MDIDRPFMTVGHRFRARALTTPTTLAPYLAADDAIASRYFFAGGDAVPLPLATDYLAGCTEVIAVEPVAGGDPQAAVTISGMDPQHLHCFLSAFRFAQTASPFVFGGLLLAMDLVFIRWPIRRVRFDVMAFNLPQFAFAATQADHEGVRRDWIEWNDRTWDAHLFSIARSRWEDEIRPFVRRWA